MRCDAMRCTGERWESESQWERSGQCTGQDWSRGAATQGKTANWRDAEGRTALACGAWDLATQGRNARPEVGLASRLGAGFPMHNLKISLLSWSKDQRSIAHPVAKHVTNTTVDDRRAASLYGTTWRSRPLRFRNLSSSPYLDKPPRPRSPAMTAARRAMDRQLQDVESSRPSPSRSPDTTLLATATVWSRVRIAVPRLHGQC